MNILTKQGALKLVLLFLMSLVLVSCNTIKYRGANVQTIKNWIGWQVSFKENVSNDERTKALLFIDKYILESTYKTAGNISYINISHLPAVNSDNASAGTIRITVDLGTVATGVVPHPHPPCCQPPIMPGDGIQIREIGRSE